MRTLHLVAGSIVVYAIVACGSATMGTPLGGWAKDAEPSLPYDGAGLIGAMADALANPVPEAAAQAAQPITATEICSKQETYAGQPSLYAEHAFPGYTAAQLTALRVLVTETAANTVIPSYTQSQSAAYVRDGYAAVFCGVAANPSFTSVTFILPQ